MMTAPAPAPVTIAELEAILAEGEARCAEVRALLDGIYARLADGQHWTGRDD